MAELNIPVEIAQPSTGMAQAVLHELKDHLQALLEQNKSHVIDISSLPLSDTDKKELESVLGQGEISAVLSALGESRIVETHYHGIWWIKHFADNGALVSELIEITQVPEILHSHPDDIQQSIKQISKLVQQQQEHKYE